MERTKEYSVVNDTLKALKNQGLLERYFQKGHSFSSQSRYGLFGTSPFNKGSVYEAELLLLYYIFKSFSNTFYSNSKILFLLPQVKTLYNGFFDAFR